MIRSFWKSLYGEVPAEFQSSYPMDESVRRLARATGRSVFSAFTRQRAVGTVKRSRVSLQRAIPFIGNSFKPFFIGRFEERDGRVTLAGRFTLLWLAKALASLWFGFVMLWTALAVGVMAIHGPTDDNWWLPAFGTGMLAAGMGFAWICRWFARNDIEWISNVIRQALSAEPADNGRPGEPRPD
jgi:hypothetical protein